jgi:hypothetical protein
MNILMGMRKWHKPLYNVNGNGKSNQKDPLNIKETTSKFLEKQKNRVL